MKKRTKAILAAALAAVVAVSALAFTACGGESGFARVYEMMDWSVKLYDGDRSHGSQGNGSR